MTGAPALQHGQCDQGPAALLPGRPGISLSQRSHSRKVATVGLLVTTVLCLSSRPSWSASWSNFKAQMVASAVAGILPSEVGTFLGSSDVDFVLGWSGQFPFTESHRHRVAYGLDWVPGRENRHWRGHVGYRYGGRYLFGGLGVMVDHTETTAAPELGFKFLHVINEGVDPSLHVLVRADVRIDPGVSGLTLLLGWNIL
jgi:hypothetical protein